MSDKFRNLHRRYRKTTKVNLIALSLMLFTVFYTSMFGTVHKLNKLLNNLSELDISQCIEEAEVVDKISSVLGFLSGVTAKAYVIFLITVALGVVLPMLLSTCINRLILNCAISSSVSDKQYNTIKFVTLFVMILSDLPAIWSAFTVVPVIVSNDIILKYSHHVLALIFIIVGAIVLNFVLIVKENI